MEKLKEIFGGRSLTYDELQAAIAADGRVKLCDLSEGGYVDRAKWDRLNGELTRARERAEKELGELRDRWQRDVSAARLQSEVDLALYAAGAKNPRLVRAALDMSVLRPGPDGVEGLREQIDALRASDGYLFGEERSLPRFDTGAAHGAVAADPAEMSDADYYTSLYGNR